MNFAIKYRPKNLSDIIGHEKVIKDLLKRKEIGDFPNVILFIGNPGSGKTTLQKIVTKMLLCLNKESVDCCNECDVCKTINSEINSNYYFEYNASNLGIDDMRNIEEIAMTKSMSIAKSKVIIIDELQELSSNKKAMKNILKVLEKPLKNTYFVLGTMDASKIHKSIMRRAVKYRLNELDGKLVGKALMDICKKEDIDLKDEQKIKTIVTLTQNSNGCVGEVIPYLERVIYSDLWDENDLLNELGILSQESTNHIIHDMLNGDIEVLSNKITEDVINNIKSTLLLYYKITSGYELEFWRKNALDGIGDFPVQCVQFAIQKIFELSKYFYINQALIDFALIEIINFCKENKPKVRRELKE